MLLLNDYSYFELLAVKMMTACGIKSQKSETGAIKQPIIAIINMSNQQNVVMTFVPF